jgi:hypothetical protein
MLQSRQQSPRYRLLHLSLEVLEVSIQRGRRHAHLRPRLALGQQPTPAHQRKASRGQTWLGDGQRTPPVRRNRKQEVFWQWHPHKIPQPRPRRRPYCRPLRELVDSR